MLITDRIRGFEKTSNAPEGIKLPQRGTGASAGYDIYAPEDIEIPAHGFSKLIPMYIKAYMPPYGKFSLCLAIGIIIWLASFSLL